MDNDLNNESSDAPAPKKVYWMPRIALAAFLIGSVAVLSGFALGGGFGGIRFGLACWMAAYFLILLDNFKRKLDVQTRGGIVRHKDGPWRYALPYIPLVALGLGGLFGLWAWI